MSVRSNRSQQQFQFDGTRTQRNVTAAASRQGNNDRQAYEVPRGVTVTIADMASPSQYGGSAANQRPESGVRRRVAHVSQGNVEANAATDLDQIMTDQIMAMQSLSCHCLDGSSHAAKRRFRELLNRLYSTVSKFLPRETA